MEKILKFMLLGIALILIGVLGAVMFQYTDSYFPLILLIVCPLAGILCCVRGLFIKSDSDEKKNK